METKFNVGDILKADVKAQGMIVGRLYTVDSINTEFLPWGNFVRYVLRDGSKLLSIGNAHFLLSKVG